MSFTPQSQNWNGRHAVLFVHGVGNATPGEYTSLVNSVRTLLGADAGNVAMYELYYDVYNDWMNDKMPLASGLSALASELHAGFGTDELGKAAAEFAGDVIWPVLHSAPRQMVRERYLAQLKQVVRDGIRSNVGAWSQRITIICHSLGCFHTYEALHAAASDSQHALRPLSNGVTIANVVFMASPVQLIRHVASLTGGVVPDASALATLAGSKLEIPGESSVTGFREPMVRNWVSIRGVLDPVCGYLFRSRVANCVMEVDGQHTIDDQQSFTNVTSAADLAQVLAAARRSDGPPVAALDNPHSWQGYIDRHAADLRNWILS